MPKFVIRKVYTAELIADTREDAERNAVDCFDANSTPTYEVHRFKSPNKPKVKDAAPATESATTAVPEA
jgi:hypothetical protein